MSSGPQNDADEGHRGLKERIAHPFPSLREKLKDTHLYDVKVKAVHAKNKLGKFKNLVNSNHRHDEEHEKRTDEKRTRICEGHRFESFAPERDGNLVKWYVDGRDYFWAVSVALENAKETIYIEDWWLSPELFLRRPPFYNHDYRLDALLKKKAEEGVKIYIVVYKEVSAALTCNSQHTKRHLMGLIKEGQPGYGNITVMRHPDHNVLENASDMTFYWAHHEKFLVIDYAVAFIGGLDLCYGRWDNKQHPLADVHPSGVQNEIFPGQDYNNNRILDFESVQDWKSNQLSKTEYGRMPWHDVAMGVIGPCVYDIAEHFVLRWNFIKRDKYKRDDRYDWLTLEGRQGEDEDLVGVQRPKHPVGEYIHHPLTPLSTKNLDNRGTVHAQLVRSSADWSSGILPPEHSIQAAYCNLIANAQHYVYIENQFFITATGEEQAPIHNQIGRAIVEAVVKAGKEGRKFRVIILIPAIPGFAGDLREDAATGTRAIMDYQYKSICRGEHSIFAQIEAQGVNPRDYIFVFNLRSYDRINANRKLRGQEEKSGMTYKELQQTELEELEAPLDDEGAAKAKAADMRRKFAGDEEAVGLGDQGGIIDPDSIADDAMLTDKKPSTESWDGEPESEKENFFQEELYIHAKILIVDDRTVICGSSNINDRSQLGFHDSELSIVLQDTAELDTQMAGQPFKAARLAHELWDLWCERATTNTAVFRDLFHADPDDSIRTFADYDKFTPNPKTDKEHKQGHLYVGDMPVEQVRRELDRIRGHLVWMPLRFLEEEQMAEKGLQVNAYTESIYT